MSDHEHFRLAMPIVARALLGEPNKALSKKTELRFGSNGSLAVHLDKGTWRDHQNEQGGGVLALIETHRGVTGREAIEYIRSLGCDVPDRDGPMPRRAAGGPRNPPAGEQNRAPFEDLDEGWPPPFEPDARPEPAPKAKVRKEIVATYDYVDGKGALVYQVVRFEPKTFAQRRKPRPDDAPEKIKGGWVWNLEGIDHGLYRYDLIAEERREKPEDRRTLFLCEGEKDVHTIESLGLFATTNSGGAKNWSDKHAGQLAGFDVVVLVDNDEAGRARVDKVAPGLSASAARLRVLDLAAHWPDMPAKADVSDWIGLGHGKKDFLALVGQCPDWEPAPYKSKFGAIPMAKLFEVGEPYRWLIKGVLPEDEVAMVFGEPQSGKSFLALDMAMAIARGVDFMGKKVPEPKGVIYCAFEGGKGFRNRVQGYFKGQDVAPDPTLPFVLLTRRSNLFDSEEVIVGLIEEIQHWASTFKVPLGLVVFDTISASTAGMNENAGDEVSRFIANIHRICERVGRATGLLVHHVPKGGGTPRGSGKLTGDLETTLSVEFKMLDAKEGIVARDAMGRELREVKIKKQREGERGSLSPFTLPSTELRKDADGDPVTTCYVQPAAGFDTRDRTLSDTGRRSVQRESDGRLVLKANQMTAMQTLVAVLKKDGRQPNRPVDGLPAGADCVTLSDWRKALEAIIAQEGEEPEKLTERTKKAIQRAADLFVSRKIIGKSGDWVWRGKERIVGIDAPPKKKEDDPSPAAGLPDGVDETLNFI